MIGREEEAVELFERLLALRNDLGLLSEEYDPLAGRLVGNFPQAFSHVSLINSAFRLSGNDPLAVGSRRTKTLVVDKSTVMAPMMQRMKRLGRVAIGAPPGGRSALTAKHRANGKSPSERQVTDRKGRERGS